MKTSTSQLLWIIQHPAITWKLISLVNRSKKNPAEKHQKLWKYLTFSPFVGKVCKENIRHVSLLFWFHQLNHVFTLQLSGLWWICLYFYITEDFTDESEVVEVNHVTVQEAGFIKQERKRYKRKKKSFMFDKNLNSQMHQTGCNYLKSQRFIVRSSWTAEIFKKNPFMQKKQPHRC